MARTKTQQIIDDITEQIRSGQLKPGDKLPSTSQLCAQYGVSLSVVRNAVLWLKAKDMVEGLPGAGVFVTDQAKGSADRQPGPS